MKDIVLDANLLSDFLAQYFDRNQADHGYGKFIAVGRITATLARRLNRIAGEFAVSGDPITSGLVISSSLGFIELARQFPATSKGRFLVENLYDFIQEPPGWFSIAPVDLELLPFFLEVPPTVVVNESVENVEWTDAIHAATALSRGDGSLIATTDHRIIAIPALTHRNAL